MQHQSVWLAVCVAFTTPPIPPPLAPSARSNHQLLVARLRSPVTPCLSQQVAGQPCSGRLLCYNNDMFQRRSDACCRLVAAPELWREALLARRQQRTLGRLKQLVKTESWLSLAKHKGHFCMAAEVVLVAQGLPLSYQGS